MEPLFILDNLLNFMAPALCTGAMVAAFAPVFGMARRAGVSLLWQMAVNALVGVLALAAGLWYFGHDGKMESYAAMVVLIGSAQWALGKRA